MMKEKLKNNGSFFSWLSLGFLAVIWGSSFILMKRGLEAYSATEVGALRVVISATILLPLALRSHKEYLQKYWKHFLFFAALTNLGPAILFATAQTRISSSLAGVLNSMTPIFTFSIGVLFYGTAFRVNQAVGLVLGIIGSGVLILFSGGELGEINFFAFFCGAGNTVLRNRLKLSEQALQGYSPCCSYLLGFHDDTSGGAGDPPCIRICAYHHHAPQGTAIVRIYRYPRCGRHRDVADPF